MYKIDKEIKTYEMDVQISYRLHTKVSTKSNLQSIQSGYKRYY